MHMKRISQNSYRQTALAILSSLTILLALISGLRNTVWRDNIVLWSDVVRKAPNNERAHLSLGSAYSVAGMAEKAIAHLTTALQLRPNTASTYNNLGLEYAIAGLFDNITTPSGSIPPATKPISTGGMRLMRKDCPTKRLTITLRL